VSKLPKKIKKQDIESCKVRMKWKRMEIHLSGKWPPAQVQEEYERAV
jgi:hypothetical protein